MQSEHLAAASISLLENYRPRADLGGSPHQWSPDPGCNRCVECTLDTSIIPPVTATVVVSKILARSWMAKHREDFSPLRSDIDCNVKLLTHRAVAVCSHGHWDVNMCQYVSVRVGDICRVRSHRDCSSWDTSVGRQELSLVAVDLQTLTQSLPPYHVIIVISSQRDFPFTPCKEQAS